MSAKGRAAEGYVPDPKGFFATQPQVTRAILPYLGIEPNMKILEPSCGKGAIAKVLRQEYGMDIIIIGVEIDHHHGRRRHVEAVVRAGEAARHHGEVDRGRSPESAARGRVKLGVGGEDHHAGLV